MADVTEKCVGTDVLDSLTPAQQIIKIVNQELTALMGGTNARLTTASKGPTVVMMVGLQGAVKTSCRWWASSWTSPSSRWARSTR